MKQQFGCSCLPAARHRAWRVTGVTIWLVSRHAQSAAKELLTGQFVKRAPFTRSVKETAHAIPGHGIGPLMSSLAVVERCVLTIASHGRLPKQRFRLKTALRRRHAVLLLLDVNIQPGAYIRLSVMDVSNAAVAAVRGRCLNSRSRPHCGHPGV